MGKMAFDMHDTHHIFAPIGMLARREQLQLALHSLKY